MEARRGFTGAHMRKLTNQDIADAKTLRQMGWPVSQIARHYDITPPAMKYHLQDITPWSAQQVLNNLREAA